MKNKEYRYIYIVLCIILGLIGIVCYMYQFKEIFNWDNNLNYIEILFAINFIIIILYTGCFIRRFFNLLHGNYQFTDFVNKRSNDIDGITIHNELKKIERNYKFIKIGRFLLILLLILVAFINLSLSIFNLGIAVFLLFWGDSITDTIIISMLISSIAYMKFLNLTFQYIKKILIKIF